MNKDILGLTVEDLFDDVNRLKKRVSELKASISKLWQKFEDYKKKQEGIE